jgi:antitoxin (DNA-binding transcriptional repressor) of toxin-antitoxin stability system
MKTTSVQQVPQQWADILRWIADGEEVEMTQQDRVVARLVPAPAPTPDFLARATAVWGQTPPGKTLSAIVSEDRESAS